MSVLAPHDSKPRADRQNNAQFENDWPNTTFLNNTGW